MIDLKEIKKRAKAAHGEYPDYWDDLSRDLSEQRICHSSAVAHIAGMDPPTTLALVAALEAMAQSLRDYRADRGEFTPPETAADILREYGITTGDIDE